jgi:hypothetical protein
LNGINNHGFEEPNPYPYKKKDPSEFVIGVLGGSVAEQWAHWNRTDPSFVRRLKELVPALKDRKIVILTMSIAGYKQPQQYFVASYFVESVDIFLSIEGFNEVNNTLPPAIYPAEFPIAGYLIYRHGERLTEARATVKKWLSFYKGSMSLAQRFPFLRRSLLWYALSRWSDSQLNARTDKLSREGAAELARELRGKRSFWGPVRPSLEASRLAALNVWKKYLKLQTAVVEATGKRSFIFFQPNQYLQGSKQFSELELRTAYTPSLRAETMNRLLSMWRGAIPELQDAGVKIYDLSQVFTKVVDTVYIDDCCHVNNLGQRVMADAIAERLASPLSRMLRTHK